MSAPEAEIGRALAAVDFVGMYLWQLVQIRIWTASIAHTVTSSTQLLQSWDLDLVDLCLWSCENNWEMVGAIDNKPVVKVGLTRSVGAQYTTGEKWRNNSRKNEEKETKLK